MGHEITGFSFLITEVSSGGIVGRLQKWTEELAKRGYVVEVHSLRDKSSKFSRKVRAETFPFASVWVHTYDSLDRADRMIDSIISGPQFSRTNVIVSSTFTRSGLLVDRLKRLGWAGVHVEVVPGDGRAQISSLSENLRRCDLVGAVSKAVEIRVSSIVPGKPVVLLPGGARVSEGSGNTQHPKSTGGPFRLCYAGRMDAFQKRVFDLPIIARTLEEVGVHCQWLLAGAGADASELRSRFERLGLMFSPVFYGHLSSAALMEVFNTAHAFVLPSAFEGLSNSLCEAGAAGSVPVVSRVSGSEDVVDCGQSGFIVEIGDTHGFSQAIRSLACDEDLWRTMSTRIREKVQNHYSVSVVMDRLVSAVAYLLRKSAKIDHESEYESAPGLLDRRFLPNWLVRRIRRTWRQLRP